MSERIRQPNDFDRPLARMMQVDENLFDDTYTLGDYMAEMNRRMWEAELRAVLFDEELDAGMGS